MKKNLTKENIITLVIDIILFAILSTIIVVGAVFAILEI